MDMPRYVAAEGRFRTLVTPVARQRLEDLRRTAAKRGDDGFGAKYLKSGRYLREKTARALELGLHRFTSPQRILDIGCGPGYFVFVCGRLGHDAIGLDIPDNHFYTAITGALGVRRIEGRIWAGEPLPESLAGPFDLITAFSASFHQHGAGGSYWDERAWEAFLTDLRPRLTLGGRVYMRLNMGPFVTLSRYANVEAALSSAAGYMYRRVNHRTALLTRTA